MTSRQNIEGLGKNNCSSFAQTVRFLKMLDQRVRDFVLETGEEFPLDSLASIMRRAVDPGTADRMYVANVDLKDFNAVEGFIKKCENRLHGRGGGADVELKSELLWALVVPLAGVGNRLVELGAVKGLLAVPKFPQEAARALPAQADRVD